MVTTLDEWFDWLERDQLKSPHTLATYRRTWRTWTVDPLAATVDDAETWWASRVGKSVGTRRNELAAVRSFYRWAIRFGHVAADPTRRITPPKAPQRLSEQLCDLRAGLLGKTRAMLLWYAPDWPVDPAAVEGFYTGKGCP